MLEAHLKQDFLIHVRHSAQTRNAGGVFPDHFLRKLGLD